MADVSTAQTPKEFTVATWNAHCLNPNPQAAAEHLFTMEPRWDILCLQEVSDELEKALLKKTC